MTATSTPAPVAPEVVAPIASRTSASVVPGAAAAACLPEPLSAQPLTGLSSMTAATPAVASSAPSRAGRHLRDEAVDDGQRLPDGAAAALDGALRGCEPVGLGANDHRLHGALRAPA